MKEHFCPAEKSIITYQDKCNWCGELESQEPVAWVDPATLYQLKIGLEGVHLVYETEMVNSLPLYEKPQGWRDNVAQAYQQGFDDGCKSMSAGNGTQNIGCLGMPVNVPVTPPQRTEQEPCAKHCEATAFEIVIKNLQGEIERMKTAQRTWVGLTDEEVELYWDWEDFQCGCGPSTLFAMVRDIEARLKDRNI